MANLPIETFRCSGNVLKTRFQVMCFALRKYYSLPATQFCGEDFSWRDESMNDCSLSGADFNLSRFEDHVSIFAEFNNGDITA